MAKRNGNNQIVKLLLQRAQEQRGGLPPQACTIIGVSRTSYVLRLTEKETVLHLHYVIAQTECQGCCYYDASTDEPGISEQMIGMDALEVVKAEAPMSIAALDAVYGSLRRECDDCVLLEGSNVEKADRRAKVVCDEAVRLLERCRGRSGARTVTNVGVIGSMLSLLKEVGSLRVQASDYYRGIANQTVHGTKVEWGSETPRLIADSDVAIVTGMTLANNTLGDILAAAKRSGTKLVMFAQTGANFAEEYLRLGVDVVVSEPFPFYLVGPGPTKLQIYRQRN